MRQAPYWFYNGNPLSELLEEGAEEEHGFLEDSAGDPDLLGSVLARLDEIEDEKHLRLREVERAIGALEDALSAFREVERKTYREWEKMKGGSNHHIYYGIDVTDAVLDTDVDKALSEIERALDNHADTVSVSFPINDSYNPRYNSAGGIGRAKTAIDTIRKIFL